MPATDTQQIEQSVVAAYAAYFADFQRHDRAATAAHFTAPLCHVREGRVTIFTTEPDVANLLETIWAALSTKDYVRSSLTGRAVTVLDDHTALLRAQGTRYDRSDVAFEDFDLLYTLVRAGPGDAWRITVITSIAQGR